MWVLEAFSLANQKEFFELNLKQHDHFCLEVLEAYQEVNFRKVFNIFCTSGCAKFLVTAYLSFTICRYSLYLNSSRGTVDS